MVSPSVVLNVRVLVDETVLEDWFVMMILEGLELLVGYADCV